MNTIALLEKLISFPTVSADSNLPLIGFVKDYLDKRGFECRLIPNRIADKANLFASIGPDNRDGIILSGHTDVVSVAHERWRSDPFKLIERDGALFGRGAADMKGFLAAALIAADFASKRPLSRPLHLALSYDEEIGCVGVRSLLSDLKARSFRAALCIVGEPTSMQIATGHKGKLAARANCTGVEGHSAMAPLYLNAIHLAADFVSLLRRYQARIAEIGPRDEGYAVPYSTIHAGRIGGGSALNIVASQAFVDFEIRHSAAEDPLLLLEDLKMEVSKMLAPIRERFAQAHIEFIMANEYPGLAVPNDAPAVDFVSALLTTASLSKVAFGSEAGLFSSQLGVPTLIVGPGSMDQGHKPNEFITRDQLDQCDAFLARLIETL